MRAELQKKNIVVIILRDGYHGLIKIKNANKYPVEIEDAVRLPDFVKFAELAKSMGAQGREVRNIDELRDALKQAIEDASAEVNGQSTLIEAFVSYDVKFKNIKSNYPPEKRLDIRDKIIKRDDNWRELLKE